MSRKTNEERDQAIAQLREWIKPGDTVYTVLDSVSRSGMSRQIRVVLLKSEPYCPACNYAPASCLNQPACKVARVEYDHYPSRCETLHPNYAVGKALGLKHAKRNGYEQDALVVQGGGMDMGFAIVYQLSQKLYPEYTCLGTRTCPSPSNGDPTHHTPGNVHRDGYAVSQRWL